MSGYNLPPGVTVNDIEEVQSWGPLDDMIHTITEWVYEAAKTDSFSGLEDVIADALMAYERATGVKQ